MSSTRPKVVVVGDDRIIATTLSAILQKSGFDAVPFCDPKQALAAIENTPPDMIISDVVMPGLTGIELALGITEVCPKCKVLLFWGQAATTNLLETARSQGYNFELLQNPIHPNDLLKIIRAVIGGPQPV